VSQIQVLERGNEGGCYTIDATRTS